MYKARKENETKHCALRPPFASQASIALNVIILNWKLIILIEEISWKLRSLPPAHYIFKIENFSLLSDIKAESFTSADFEVGGYKWKLSVYPGGNKKKNGDGYISLYLVLSEFNKITFTKEVNVYFKLFVYDYTRDNYWAVQDGNDKVRRFRGSKREWGFDKLISITDFKDDSNGYLVDDCCMFGAEILVIDNANKGECMSLEVHPKGGSRAEGKSLSLYLRLEDDENGRKLYAEFMLRVRNQFEGKHREWKAQHDFKSKYGWGYPYFISLSDLNDKSKGFIHNNNLIVEVEIQAMTVIKELS
ncbi:BTB/POZ and MATH domain-containing protein 6-like [Mercurialis annua]|uniref:BTB/POZ and MATH domain-containing protein 6-like n=1 Tax=Mercurialis annua TaxID=3986 RepID=UPI00215FD42C|nr:BTB/POZ and MATH domain-containing protein 6-like [Mercurialis annua]